MTLQLQTESPSEYDIFEGQQHEHVARKMSEVIVTENIKIIGLEGCLGSGKSTIIHFVKKHLKDSQFRFIEFDAELYHFGTTKKALIDLIYQGFKAAPGIDSKALTDHRDNALGNTLRYTRKQKSKISFWTISFLLSSVLAIQSLRYFLNDINKLAMGSTLSSWLFLIELLCLFSPAIVLGLFCLVGKRSEDFTVSDILKKNSEDTITEKMLISREVGTLELHTALQGFIQCLPPEARFILIIDNLDRIHSNKVKELWSDMELISSTAGEKLKIILPYSAEHVSKSLSEDRGEGHEFIAKRIPVNFLVPPILSAGWRHGFQTLWAETLAEPVPHACYEVAELLERFLPQHHSQITPRFMKKLINDIKITALTLPERPDHHVLIACYLLLVRYAGHPFTRLMLEYQEEPSEAFMAQHGLERAFCRNMAKTQMQFARIYHHDNASWREYLLCAHYQTSAVLAKSELLDEPMRAALNNSDLPAFLTLYDIFGFENAWRRLLHGTDPVLWCRLLADVSPESLENIRGLLKETVMLLDLNYARQQQEPYSPAFVKALCALRAKGVLTGQEVFIAQQAQRLMEELVRYNNATNLDDESFNLALFEEIDRYAVLTGNNMLTQLKNPLSGRMYYRFLFENEDDLPALDIASLTLNYGQLSLAIQDYLADDSDGDIFAPGILRHLKINNEELNKLIASSMPIQSNQNLENFRLGIEIKTLAAFRQIILTHSWHTTSYLSAYVQQTTLLASHPAEVAAHALAHMIALGDFTGVDTYLPYTDVPEFAPVLTNYLLYMQSFERLLTALAQPKVAPVLIPSLRSLMENSRVRALHPWNYVTQHFSLIAGAVGQSLTLSFFVSWENHVVTAVVKQGVTELSPDFLHAVWLSEAWKDTQDALNQALFDILEDKTGILAAIDDLHSNQLAILQQAVDDDIRHPGNLDILAFHDWYVDTELSRLLKPSNCRRLFDLLSIEQQAEAAKALMDVLFTRDIDVKRHIVLLQDFGDKLVYDESSIQGARRTIARLFTHASQHPDIARWLDGQIFHFSKWSQEDSRSAVAGIFDHREHYPSLLESRYIRNRLSEIEDEAVGSEE
ncbi:hypothetical protein EGH55_20750 [Klebsiella aerogenes]|uniref:P-loop NTPase fold protein n=1 Tax=Klebsiella aerogenes TaxID=548 RepID=UPI000F7F892F|nr:P-loop NTPase fold protein [Klebsiella aerogenes]RSV87663.1 hypothetical protein EGH55_20750 [Klebsiella aerogenes]